MANQAPDLQQLNSWSSNWSSIKVAVLGLGKSGFSVADTLNELGSKLLVVSEAADEEILDILDVLGVESVIDQNAQVLQNALDAFAPDLLIVSPGVAPTTAIVEKANRSGIPIWTDIDLAWRLRDRYVSGSRC
jgi:UDP-N-acetylmuramoylalanine--D-glutamate ligase